MLGWLFTPCISADVQKLTTKEDVLAGSFVMRKAYQEHTCRHTQRQFEGSKAILFCQNYSDIQIETLIIYILYIELDHFNRTET